MVRRLQLTNFKSFRTLDLRLQPFTVLIGPNGVGKTSILRSLRLASRLGTVHGLLGHKLAPYDELFSGPDEVANLLRRPDADAFSVGIGLDDDEGFDFEVDVTGGKPTRVATSVRTPAGTERVVLPPASSDTNTRAIFDSPVLRRLDASRLLQLDPRVLTQAAAVPHGRPALGDDGGGLATLLDYMISRRDGSVERVEEALQRVVPSFRRVRCEPVELGWEEMEVVTVDRTALDRRVKRTGPGRVLELEFSRIGRIPAAEVSEGTLLALALLAVIHGPECPRLLLLDDVDRALHPRAQVELVKLLKAVLAQDGELQIVCTSHSPMVVAGCATEEVVHLEFDGEGSPAVRPSRGDPPWMTPSEIMADYFGIRQLAAADMMQRYGLLAGNPRRTDAEDAEARELLRKLKDADADPGWTPVPRRRAQKDTKAPA